MNEVILIGRLTRDVELQHTRNQNVAVCRFTLAVDHERKEKDGTRKAEFIDIQCWAQTAELCAKYLGKGRKVCVRGELRVDSYTSNDGTKYRKAYIEADYVEFLDSKRDVEAGAAPMPQEPMPQELDDAGFSDIKDEELPF